MANGMAGQLQGLRRALSALKVDVKGKVRPQQAIAPQGGAHTLPLLPPPVLVAASTAWQAGLLQFALLLMLLNVHCPLQLRRSLRSFALSMELSWTMWWVAGIVRVLCRLCMELQCKGWLLCQAGWFAQLSLRVLQPAAALRQRLPPLLQ